MGKTSAVTVYPARTGRRLSLACLLGIATVVSLPTTLIAKSIVGIGIAKSNDRVYTWFDDGTVTQGDSGNLQKYEMRRANTYHVPGGSPLDIVAMSIGGSDHVFTWYTDGTCSEGTSTELGVYHGRLPVNLHGINISYVAGIGIAASNGYVYIWYKNQKQSVGTPLDFQAHQAPEHYDLLIDPLKPATPLTPQDIEEIDIAKDDRVYTWFRNGIVAIGTPTELGKWGVDAYLRGHVLYNWFGRTRKPNRPTRKVFGHPAGIPPTTTYCSSHDAMVAASPNFIGMSETSSLKFTTRSGNALDLGLTGSSCDGFFSARDFFAGFFDPKSEVFVDHNVGFTRPCDDPSFPATNNVDAAGVDHKFCLTDIYDMRVIFDPKSNHFFITAQVRPVSLFPVTPDDPIPNPSWACAHFRRPDKSVAWTGDPKICSLARHHKLLAVSKSEDPRDGFHQYLVTENTIADWPWIGVNGSRVVLSNHGYMDEPPVVALEAGIVQVFDLDSVAAGKHHPPYFEYFRDALDGLVIAMTPTHHGDTQGLTFLLSRPGSSLGRLTILGFPNAPDPWQAPPLLVTHEFSISLKAPSVEGAVFRNGTLFFVDATHSDKSGPLPAGSTVQNGVRVVSVHVHPNGQNLDSSVDLDETFEPSDTSTSFDDPSIDVNRNGTILIGYHTELRDWHDPLSVARARVWPGGHPSGTDLLVTPGTNSGGTSSCKQPCRQKNDFTTTVVDPADDISFWTALPFTVKGSVHTSITRVPAP